MDEVADADPVPVEAPAPAPQITTMPAEPSLWDMEKAWRGLPADTELPTSIVARRVSKQDDGVTHCRRCGGVAYTGTIVFLSSGAPAHVMAPQKCVGCGELRQANWP